MKGDIQDRLDTHRKELILGALRGANGKHADAARLLGISQTTLYRWLKTLGISNSYGRIVTKGQAPK